MTRFLTYIVVILLLLPTWAGAADIIIPVHLQAKASVIRSDLDGLWEKALVIRFRNGGASFPQRTVLCGYLPL